MFLRTINTTSNDLYGVDVMKLRDTALGLVALNERYGRRIDIDGTR